MATDGRNDSSFNHQDNFRHQEEVLESPRTLPLPTKENMMVLNNGLKGYKEQIKLKSPKLCFRTSCMEYLNILSVSVVNLPELI